MLVTLGVAHTVANDETVFRDTAAATVAVVLREDEARCSGDSVEVTAASFEQNKKHVCPLQNRLKAFS